MQLYVLAICADIHLLMVPQGEFQVVSVDTSTNYIPIMTKNIVKFSLHLFQAIKLDM